ncbi:TIGR03089 family protein [Cellulomonas shaoxiangyii]|uniref:TIGR03089 family protein n=2 Tax=Cellulomonas shaoxiangyii TaxID=2566013 RepID=A0A4P7SPJ7_9CELL|nr:TIGR03089 family protein [Cellulomonas shaoxiangyii]TGY84817.1 TIGR03089 family protein [Cellulomonas shaoxiangyii]
MLPQLLDGLARDPGRPRVTWYGDGERVELSGTVLLNWVTKTTNLLVEELDAAPGTRVLLDLPAYWRTLTWAPAVWRCGATVVLPGDDGGSVDARPVDVVVTDRPDAHDPRSPLVAVAPAALARSWPGALPAGALDAASSVMTYADALGWVPPTDVDAPALVTATGATAHAELVAAALAQHTWAPTRPRVALDVPRAASRAAALEATLTTALAAWARDGSLVLLDAAAHDPAERERAVRGERVDVDTAR